MSRAGLVRALVTSIVTCLVCMSCQGASPSPTATAPSPVEPTASPRPIATSAVTPTTSPQPALPFPGAKLVLKSGFEDGVVLNDFQNRFGQWRQEIKGADQGYDWGRLPGSPADFQYLVSGNDARTSNDLKRFVETRIDTVTWRDGNSTKALYQAVRGEAYQWVDDVELWSFTP